MSLKKTFLYASIFVGLGFSQLSSASGVMTAEDIGNVDRVAAKNEKEQQQLAKAAGLLANYEISANKLLVKLKNEDTTAAEISSKASELLLLSEEVIASASFRLPQCGEYLSKTLALKDSLATISNETLEKDYHHDGALPKAPAECYHTKDLFVHPASVIVLTRDDPSLNDATKSSINAEISEVLAHTEIVRQLVIY
jgi:hypothetical protein